MSIPAPPPPTSLPLPDPLAYDGEPREYARALMQRKDEIEKEIDVLNDVLSSHGVSSTTSLIDPEGYPRGDIDVYSITHTRSALARLTTDLRECTQLLGPAIDAAFSAGGPSSQLNGTTPASIPNGHPEPRPVELPDTWPSAPLAKVESVARGSPAEQAGLSAGDRIYVFGDITAGTANAFQAIGALVPRSEGTALRLLVQRGEERIALTLTPRGGWGGRGMLGCHILPI